MAIIRKRSAGFTLIEMLVVIAILSILAMLLMPALQSALESSRQVQCANQIKQWSICMNTYADDWGGYYPAANIGRSTVTSWYDNNDVIEPYIGLNVDARRRAFTCPSWRGEKSQGNATSYCLWYPDNTNNYYAPSRNYSKRPSRLVLLFDGRAQTATAFYTWLVSGNSGFTWTASWVNTFKGMVYTAAGDNGWGDAYRHPGRQLTTAFWDLHISTVREGQIDTDPALAAPDRAK